jgi:2'-5' RNA ligase
LSINFLGEADFKKIDKILNIQAAWQYHKQQLKIIYDDASTFKLNDLMVAIQTLGS